MVNPMASALSGLKTFEKKMQVTANNVANVNTNGFKASRATSQDVSGQAVATTAGTAEAGRGNSIAAIGSSFSQGSLESTDSPTDLAIGGKGFFVLRDPHDPGNAFYTRTGNFRFDTDGNLSTPGGYIAQGWPVDSNGQPAGSIGDIALSSLVAIPSQTTIATVVTNLDSNATSSMAILELASDGDNPNGNYMPITSYEHQTTFEVHDSLGKTHDITVYFNPADSADTWEFIVTADPAEDQRATAEGNGLGLLARGTLTFNASGTITNMSMNSFNGAADAADPGNWSPVSPNPDGHVTFSPTFLSGTPMTVALDFGARFNVTTSVWEPESLSSTQYAQASATVFQSVNGCGAGALQSISVDSDGVITGRHSNGEVIPFFQVALADFQNPQGLSSQGGGLFSETRQSGAPVTGSPGTQGFGGIAPKSLEQSNVDITREIANTIMTRHGFQANAKIVKATDQMLQSVIDIFA